MTALTSGPIKRPLDLFARYVQRHCPAGTNCSEPAQEALEILRELDHLDRSITAEFTEVFAQHQHFMSSLIEQTFRQDPTSDFARAVAANPHFVQEWAGGQHPSLHLWDRMGGAPFSRFKPTRLISTTERIGYSTSASLSRNSQAFSANEFGL
jgi:hypothetical protein